MAGDFNKPALTDGYTLFASSVRDLCADIARGLDPALSLGTTNYPNKAIRWNSANSNWEKYDTTLGWQIMAATYNINAATASKWVTARTISLTSDATGTSTSFDGSGNTSIAVTLPTVNANTGSFGSTSAVPVITVNAKGLITAVSTATLSSMAVQPSTGVSITGGSISGTNLTLKQSLTAAPTLEGVIEWDTDQDTLVIGMADGDTARFSHDLATATIQNKTFTSGCTWTGNAIPIASGGTGAIDAAAARANLGISSVSTQDPANITFTGGSISGTNITLKQSTTAAPTPEGNIEWDTNDDLLMVGKAGSTAIFSPDNPVSVQTQTNRTFTTGCTWNGNAVPLTSGGTGGTDAASARTSLGVPSTTGTGASGSWDINISGSSASCTGNAATSSSCTGNAATASGQSFAWNNAGNAPTYLWCADNNGSAYLAHRPSISVNYANSAGTATNQSGGSVSATSGTFSGSVTVGNGQGSSSITMYDSDEGSRTIHCNSQRVGFLTQAGGWGSWCEDDGTWQSAGNVIAYASDTRLKTNFNVISGALDKLAKLGGYEFDWDMSLCKKVGFTPNSIHEHGVKAQEVQKVVPDAVHPAPFDIGFDGKSKSGQKYLTVEYEKLVPLLIAAINELRAEVEVLKGIK